jgi:hypothetical protein
MQKIARRLFKLYEQRIVIKGAYAYFVCVFELAQMESSGSFEII